MRLYDVTTGRPDGVAFTHDGGVTSVAVEDRDQAQVVVVQSEPGHEPTHEVLARLDGVALGRVTTREPTLEDAYVALVTEQPVGVDG